MHMCPFFDFLGAKRAQISSFMPFFLVFDGKKGTMIVQLLFRCRILIGRRAIFPGFSYHFSEKIAHRPEYC